MAFYPTVSSYSNGPKPIGERRPHVGRSEEEGVTPALRGLGPPVARTRGDPGTTRVGSGPRPRSTAPDTSRTVSARAPRFARPARRRRARLPGFAVAQAALHHGGTAATDHEWRMTMPAQPAPLESIDIGDIKVTYLPDGDATLSATTVFPASNDALWEAHRELFDADGRLLLTLGGFLIETGDQR